MKPRSFFFGRLLLPTIALIAFSGSAHAAVKTWTGTTNNGMATGTNWGGTAPISADSWTFTSATGAGGLLLNNNLTSGAFNVAGITFNSGSGAYVIGDGTATTNVGNTFVLTGNVLNSSTNLQTINNPFSMTAVRTFTMTTGGGNVTLGGVVSGTAGGITTAGAGTLTLSATANSYTGATLIATGTTLSLTGTLTGGGSITTAGTGILNESAAGGISGASTLTLAGTATSVLAGTNTFTGATTIGTGTTLSLTGSLSGTSIFTSGSGVLSESAAGGINGASSINLAGTGTSSLAGTNAYTGTTTIGAGTTLNLTGSLTGATAITSNGTFTQSGAGVIGAAAATLTVNAGTTTLSGLNTYTGTTTVNGGSGSTLKLDFSGATAPTTANNIIKSGNALNLAGGTLALKGGGSGGGGATNTQTLGGIGLTANTASAITLDSNGGTALNLVLGTITRNPVSALDITFAAAGTVTTTTVQAPLNGILIDSNNHAYATANGGATWVAKATGSSPFALTAFSAYSTGNGNYTSANNMDVTNGDSVTGVTVNTLRFNSASDALTLAGTNIVNTGGVLVTASGTGSSITGGTLTSGTTAAELILHDYSTLNVGSQIANANAGATAMKLTSTGTGTTTLSGANIYTGATTVLSGTLKAGVASVANVSGAFGNNSAVVLSNKSGATLDITGFNTQIGSLAGGGTLGGSVTLGAATLSVGSDNTTTSYAGTITGTGSLIKIGTGTLGLQGANTFTGTTTVSVGTLNLDFAAAASPTTQILYNGVTLSSTVGVLAMNGGTLNESNLTNTTKGQVFGATQISSGASTFTQSTRTSNAHPYVNLAGLTRTIGATVDINSSTGTGSTQTDATTGYFTTTANGASGIIGGWATANGGTDWARNTGSAGTNGGSHIYGFGQNGQTFIVTGTGTNNTSNLDMTSSFALTSGATAASVRFNTAAATTLTLAGTNVISTGGILVTPTVVANGTTIAGGVGITTSSSDLVINQFNTNASGALTISSNIIDNGGTSIGLTKTGGGTVVLSGANTFTGTIYINQGTVQLGSGTALNTSTVGTPANAISFGNAGSSTGTLTLAGNNAAVASLSTANANGITPIIQNANLSGATLTVNGNSTTTYAGLLQDGTGGGTLGLTKSGSGTQILTGYSSFTGDVNVGGGVLAINTSNNTTNPLTGGLGNTQAARNINVNNTGTLRFDAGDTMGGAASTIASTLVINSGGTVTNNGASYNTLGALTLNGGTLTGTGGSGNTQFQMYGFGGDVTVGGSSASTISGTGTTTGYHLGTSATGRTGTTFTVDDATNSSASDLNVSAVLIDRTAGLGAASLTKSGAGTMTLTGTSTYTGATTVSAGTLLVNGSLGNTAVNVNGGTLGGTGAIGGSVTVNTGATLAPGASVETLASGSLSFVTGSTFAYEMNSSALAGVSADLQIVSGNLSLDSVGLNTVNLTLADLAGSPVAFDLTTTLALINYSGTWDGGLFTVGGTELADGDTFTSGLNTWQIDYDAAGGGSNFTGQYLGGSDSFVTLTAIPEPTTALLGGLGVLTLLRRRRR